MVTLGNYKVEKCLLFLFVCFDLAGKKRHLAVFIGWMEELKKIV